MQRSTAQCITRRSPAAPLSLSGDTASFQKHTPHTPTRPFARHTSRAGELLSRAKIGENPLAFRVSVTTVSLCGGAAAPARSGDSMLTTDVGGLGISVCTGTRVNGAASDAHLASTRSRSHVQDGRHGSTGSDGSARGGLNTDVGEAVNSGGGTHFTPEKFTGSLPGRGSSSWTNRFGYSGSDIGTS